MRPLGPTSLRPSGNSSSRARSWTSRGHPSRMSRCALLIVTTSDSQRQVRPVPAQLPRRPGRRASGRHSSAFNEDGFGLISRPLHWQLGAQRPRRDARRQDVLRGDRQTTRRPSRRQRAARRVIQDAGYDMDFVWTDAGPTRMACTNCMSKPAITNSSFATPSDRSHCHRSQRKQDQT